MMKLDNYYWKFIELVINHNERIIKNSQEYKILSASCEKNCTYSLHISTILPKNELLNIILKDDLITDHEIMYLDSSKSNFIFINLEAAFTVVFDLYNMIIHHQIYYKFLIIDKMNLLEKFLDKIDNFKSIQDISQLFNDMKF